MKNIDIFLGLQLALLSICTHGIAARTVSSFTLEETTAAADEHLLAHESTDAANILLDLTSSSLFMPVITGSDMACAGEAGVTYMTTDVGPTYNWTVSGGTITAGAGTNNITVTWGLGAAGTVDLTTDDGTGPLAATTLDVVITTVSGSGTATGTCSNGGDDADPTNDYLTFNNTTNGTGATGYTISGVTLDPAVGVNGAPPPAFLDYGTTYTIQLAPGSSTGAAQFFTVADSDNSNCSYEVNLSDNGTCSDPCPVVEFTSSDDDMCVDETRALTANPPSPGTYSIVSGPATLVGNLLNATSDGTIIVEYTYSHPEPYCAANAPSTAQQTIIVNPAPADPIITGNASVCVNEMGVVYTTTHPGPTYTWAVTGGTITAGDATMPMITVDWSDDPSGTVELEVTDANECTASAVPFEVVMALTSSATITATCTNGGDDTDPANDYLTFDLTINGTGSGYTLSGVVVDMVSPAASPLSYGTTYTIQLAAGSADNVDEMITLTDVDDPTCTNTLVVTDEGHCSVAPITGPLMACAAETGVMYTTTNAGPYNWTVTGGTITGGAGTNTITVTWGRGPTGTVDLEAGSPNGSAPQLSVSISSISAIGMAMGTCNNGGGVDDYDPTNDYLTFSIAASGTGATGYTISGVTLDPTEGVDGGVPPASLDYGTTYIIQLEPGSSVGGIQTITLVDVDNTDCTADVLLSDNGPCSVPCEVVEFTSSDANMCIDDTRTLTAVPITPAPGTFSLVSGGGFATLAGDLLTATAAGTVVVRYDYMHEDPYCQAEVNVPNFVEQTIVINPTPTPVITGSAAVCANEAGVQYATTDPGPTYTWTVAGGTITAGDGTNTITVDWSDDPSGTVELLVEDPISCPGSAMTIDVFITNLPAAGTIAGMCNNGDGAGGTDPNDLDASNDFLTFDLNITGNGVGGYTLSGITPDMITPADSPLSYGTDYTVQLPAGSADNVDETVTITDVDNPSCTTTVIVTDEGHCSVTCIGARPSASLVAVPGTCTGMSPNDDGRIVMTAVSDADKYGVSMGSTYGGLMYDNATPVGAAPLDLQIGILNDGATFTVRFFNGADQCYIDYVVIVPPNSCPSDPLGYIYCEETGEIITGGSITVTPPPGGTFVLTADGSNGTYQFYTDGTPGDYMITYTPPVGNSLSTIHTTSGALDPTGEPDPFIIGSSSTDGMTLDDFTPGANPFYTTFTLQEGDPVVKNNNIPLSGCIYPIAIVAASVCADDTGMQVAKNTYYIEIASMTSGFPAPYEVTIGSYTATYNGTPLVMGPFTHSGVGGAVQIVSAVNDAGNVLASGVFEVPETLCGVNDGGQASGAFCNGPTTSPDDPAGAILAQAAPGTFEGGGSSGQVHVYILVQDGVIVETNKTGLFTNLLPGDYEVYSLNYEEMDQTLVENYLLPGEDISTVVNGGSIPSSGPLADLCLALCGPASYTVNDCYSVGSTVFLDIDNNGLNELGIGEMGIPGVVLELYAAGATPGTDDPIATTTTDSNGDYYFGGLDAGDYFVYIPTTPAGLPISSTPTTGIDNGTDSNDDGDQTGSGNPVTGITFSLGDAPEPTGADENGSGGTQDDGDFDANGDMTIDFGFFAPVSVGDTAFVDVNANGLQDPLEPPVQGVTVTLYNANGTPVTTDAEGNAITGQMMTDANGFYEFTNLPPGDYYVIFDLSTAVGGDFYIFTITTGGDDANDSDADPLTGQTDNTGPILSGGRVPDLDAGVVCNVDAEAGLDQTICSTKTVDLTTIGASITPSGSPGGFGATWTTTGTGTFDDGNAGAFGVATSYTPSPADALAGQVTLTLTTDDPSQAPFNAATCGPAMDEVLITILKVDCGTFPWNGND